MKKDVQTLMIVKLCYYLKLIMRNMPCRCAVMICKQDPSIQPQEVDRTLGGNERVSKLRFAGSWSGRSAVLVSVVANNHCHEETMMIGEAIRARGDPKKCTNHREVVVS